MMKAQGILIVVVVFLSGVDLLSWAFAPTTRVLSFGVVVQRSSSSVTSGRTSQPVLFMSDKKTDDGVVELADEEVDAKPSAAEPGAEDKKMVAPFISQGELADDVLNPDLSDPKQTRVILYIIISLLPILFLIPLMIGRELIPLEALPPVDLSN